MMAVGIHTGADLRDNSVAFLQRHFGKSFRDYFVGAPKQFCARPGAVLIDDFDDNCVAFREHGGRAIVFPQPWNCRAAVAGTGQVVSSIIEALRAWREQESSCESCGKIIL